MKGTRFGVQVAGMDKIIFGSVAEWVVKTAPVPVMVVKPFKVD
jgi:nucleotide-binding universal stress UspA family protein